MLPHTHSRVNFLITNNNRMPDDRHKIPIRKQILYLLRLLLARTKGSFRYNRAKTWNLLPSSFRNETKFSKFKIDLKKFLKEIKFL